MKVMLTRVLALGGLCALFAGVGNAASAQDYDRHDYDRMYRHDRYYHREVGPGPSRFELRRRIEEMQHIYARDMRIGDYAGARRAHMRAEELRARLRDMWRD